VRKSLLMQATSSDGVRIDFETAGRGQPLVLLHGFFGDRASWRSAGYVDALAAQYLLVLIDARGHGRSDAPHDTDSYRVGRQVPDVLAVLDALANRDDILGPLARTSVPALLLAGDRDPLLPAIQRTATHIPGGTLIQLPDCGHLDTFVRSDLTLPLVLPFLSGQSAR
jgi:pimeloyl-ACP methyl ester carboxylesterase